MKDILIRPGENPKSQVFGTSVAYPTAVVDGMMDFRAYFGRMETLAMSELHAAFLVWYQNQNPQPFNFIVDPHKYCFSVSSLWGEHTETVEDPGIPSGPVLVVGYTLIVSW